MSVAQTAHSQFEQAYQLVAAINGPLARSETGTWRASCYGTA